MKLTRADKAARAKYLREWRAKNKDKMSEYNARYWKKKVSDEKVKKYTEEKERQEGINE